MESSWVGRQQQSSGSAGAGRDWLEGAPSAGKERRRVDPRADPQAGGQRGSDVDALDAGGARMTTAGRAALE